MSRLALRAVGLLAAALTTTLALGACGTGTTPTGSLSDKEVTLRFTWWGGDSRHALTKQVIDLFEKEHPKIIIKPEYAEWGGYWDKLATQVAANDAPDIITMDGAQFSTYSLRGALYDLGKTTQYLKTDKIDPTLLKSGQINGTQYGIPSGATTWAFLVNEKLAAENGIAIPDDTTWTWDGVAATAAKISQAGKGKYWGMQSLGHDISAVQVWARQHGDQLWNDKAEVTVKPETLASWWQFILDQQQSGGTPTASLSVEGMTGTQPPTSTNKVELAAWPANQIGMFTKASGSTFKMLQLPVPKGATNNGYYLSPTMFWTASSRTEHPAEAALFIDFLANNPAAAKIMGTDRGVPANTEVRSAIAPGLSELDKKLVDLIDAISPKITWTPAPTPNGAATVGEILVRHTTEVLFKRETPEQAANAFISELKAAIKS